MNQIVINEFDFLEQAKDLAEEYYPHFADDNMHRLGRFHLAVKVLIDDDEISDDEIFDQVSEDRSDKGIDFF